jgi:hypothetical protein
VEDRRKEAEQQAVMADREVQEAEEEELRLGEVDRPGRLAGASIDLNQFRSLGQKKVTKMPDYPYPLDMFPVPGSQPKGTASS